MAGVNINEQSLIHGYQAAHKLASKSKEIREQLTTAVKHATEGSPLDSFKGGPLDNFIEGVEEIIASAEVLCGKAEEHAKKLNEKCDTFYAQILRNPSMAESAARIADVKKQLAAQQ